MGNGRQFADSDSPILRIILAIIAALGAVFAAYLLATKPVSLTIAATERAEALHTSIAMTTQAYLFDSDIAPVRTPTPAFGATLTPSPALTVESQLVQLIDNYYSCINIANSSLDSDFEKCWNLLSIQPGEFQSNLNKNDFKSFWKKYKVTYALYYCSKNLQSFVDAEYYLYERSDLSIPIGDGSVFYLEYSFALDENGWRIKGADDSISNIGSYCESHPRIEKMTLTP